MNQTNPDYSKTEEMDLPPSPQSYIGDDFYPQGKSTEYSKLSIKPDSTLSTDPEDGFDSMHQSQEKRPLQLKIICLLLVIASGIHILIILGIMKEEGIPLLFTIYFHSLFVINILAAIGLWYRKKWGWYLVMYIAITQIISHSYLLIYYFQINQVFDRVLDIVLVSYFIYYFNKHKIREMYFRRDAIPRIHSQLN